LDESVGPIPRVLLRDGPADDVRLVRPRSEQMPDLTGDPGRYHLIGELARGGMGVILKGRDVDLGRDLAVKVILEEHRDHPEMIRRFVEEAQIGGQLQHPGIVPVHEIGRFSDGRLYIAMKLVKGCTLAALLEDRKEPGDDRPRFLSLFEQVCQTMAYAHSRGVVHRDLKPSNVMVGSFGEVQVMDWGLAKVLEQGGVADELRSRLRQADLSTIRTLRSGSGADDSRAGSVLGTPAYMAPEQARGALDTVDERADVFGLGSILCEILTGLPAYSGHSTAELYRMAERAELFDALARLDSCGADLELVALAKSCLAAVAKDRPRDASVVLARLTGYLAGALSRVREAGLARARAEAFAAAERKRRVLAVALAAALLAAGLCGAAAWTWVIRERLRESENLGAQIERALDAATAKREAARAQAAGDSTLWVEAIEAARRAQALISGRYVGPALRLRANSVLQGIERERDRVEAAEKDRRMVERLAGIHNDLGVHGNDRQADAEYLAAFRSYGVDVDALEPANAGARLAASPVAAQLANALDQWAFLRRMPMHDQEGSQRLVAIAKTADPDPWRNRLRDTLDRKNLDPSEKLDKLDTLVRLASTANVERLPEASVTRLAFSLAMQGRQDLAVGLLRRAQRAHPDDFWVNADLGRELMRSGKPDEAARFFSVAVGVRPKSALALAELASALHRSGQFEEAIDFFRQGIALRPGDAHAHISLGAALLKQAEREEAVDEFSEAKRLKPGDSMVRRLIGKAWSDWGDFDAAIAECREAAREKPASAFSHDALGHALLDVGRTAEAIAEFREAIRLDPPFPPARIGLAYALLAGGEFQAALDTAGRANPGMSWPEERGRALLVRTAERMIALEARLPAFLRGDDRPSDASERAEFARVCAFRHLYATSASVWADLFAAKPELAASGAAENCYEAARAAALASCGRSSEAVPLDTAARKQLRDRAAGWIKSAITDLSARIDTSTPTARFEVAKRLGRWRVDPGLAAIRDESALAALPADERQPFRDLWARVIAVQEQSRGRLVAGAATR
jgi:serine/threonine-protein kinase